MVQAAQMEYMQSINSALKIILALRVGQMVYVIGQEVRRRAVPYWGKLEKQTCKRWWTDGMNNSKNFPAIKVAVTILLSFAMVVTLTITLTQEAWAQSADNRIFESEEEGFRLQIPQGWVIEDLDNTPFQPYAENIAMLCLENEALPGIGGEHNCQAANFTDAIFINRWSDLQSIPEFQNKSSSSDSAFGGVSSNNTTIIPTTDDLIALRILAMQNQSDSQIKIENKDVDEFTKLVNMTYQSVDRAGTILPFDDFTYNVKSTTILY